MLLFLSTLEGWLLGIALIFGCLVLRMWNKIDSLRQQAKGLRPEDRHPQDRLKDKSAIAQVEPVAAPAVDKEPNPLDWLHAGETEPVMAHKPAQLHGPAEVFLHDEPAPAFLDAKPSRFRTLIPHLKPLLFALSILAVWYGFAAWYDNLSRYVPETGDSLGDFRILYLKKTIGAILPLISSVGIALGLLFMINPRYYIYLNGWTSDDYDFYTDLQHLSVPESFRRVLVFVVLFGLLFLASLWVLLHSSPQELTL
jgi:hypothetical protein